MTKEKSGLNRNNRQGTVSNSRTVPMTQGRQTDNRIESLHYLIVCEGKETEPNYFNSMLQNKSSTVLDAEVIGAGRCTKSLVEYAKSKKTEIETKRGFRFDRVWIVFDKDDFQDFNKAIALCHEYGFKAAWTNEAFEFWFYLHFEYLDTAIGRGDYIDKLEQFIRKKEGYENFKYEKNDKDFYKILQKFGDEKKAVKFAKKMRHEFEAEINQGNYDKAKPCTTVDVLVDELRNPEKVLKEIKNSETTE